MTPPTIFELKPLEKDVIKRLENIKFAQGKALEAQRRSTSRTELTCKCTPHSTGFHNGKRHNALVACVTMVIKIL